jgi:hypothetical protein
MSKMKIDIRTYYERHNTAGRTWEETEKVLFWKDRQMEHLICWMTHINEKMANEEL